MTGLIKSFGTVGCSTSTRVDEVYFFGKTSDAVSPSAPSVIVMNVGIHQ